MIEAGIDLSTGTRPRLLNGPLASQATAGATSASHPSLLQEPSPYLAGASPFPAAGLWTCCSLGCSSSSSIFFFFSTLTSHVTLYQL